MDYFLSTDSKRILKRHFSWAPICKGGGEECSKGAVRKTTNGMINQVQRKKCELRSYLILPSESNNMCKPANNWAVDTPPKKGNVLNYGIVREGSLELHLLPN